MDCATQVKGCRANPSFAWGLVSLGVLVKEACFNEQDDEAAQRLVQRWPYPVGIAELPKQTPPREERLAEQHAPVGAAARELVLGLPQKALNRLHHLFSLPVQ